MATYVLVHGAYQGGWIWKPVIERLRTAVIACTRRRWTAARSAHTGAARHHRGDARARDRAALFYEDLTQVVLVGRAPAAW